MSNSDQRDFWSGPSGNPWVDFQPRMDATLAPVLEAVMARAAPQPGQSVLDVGCGTGASLIAAAGAVGREGRVTGLDISPVLLGLARRRTEALPQVEVIEGDAAEVRVDRVHDLLISRFGVMFFDDTAAAFRNISRNLRPGAHLVMAAWAPAGQNPWWMDPAAAARARVGTPPKVDRTQPGPFAWEDAERVTRMLCEAGLEEVAVENTQVHLTPPGDARDAARDCTRIGSAASVLNHFDAGEEDRQAVEDALAEVFSQYETNDGMRIPARINLVTARVPA